MLTLDSFSVKLADPSNEKTIIQTFSYSFIPGKIYCILGQNGSGKSSLVFSLFWHPGYQKSGVLLLDGDDTSTLSPDSLSTRWLFLSFQNVPEIPGILLKEYLRIIYNIHLATIHPEAKPLSSFLFWRLLERECRELSIDPAFLQRDLYVGFSGWEKRKIELLQIRLLDPKYIFLDEIDAGLDIDALSILTQEMQRWKQEGKCIVLITHNFHLLDTLTPDEVLVMQKGALVSSGKWELIAKIRISGFEKI